MLKKIIKFHDLDGNELTEEFYFNLTKAEIAEMELSKNGGFSTMLNDIVAAQDGEMIVATFKEIITKSVGRRSEDGRRFIKTQEITDDFVQTEAYSELFMELATDAEAGSNFVKAVMPADIAAKISEDVVPELPGAQDSNFGSKTAEDTRPAWIREDREPTKAELMSMSREQVVEVMQRKNLAV